MMPNYFELSYHFEEHKDSVGQETTALYYVYVNGF